MRSYTSKPNRKMRTIAYAMELPQFAMLTNELRKQGHTLEQEGSTKCKTGHLVTITIDGTQHFWASQNSNGKHYLVRATTDLITTTNE